MRALDWLLDLLYPPKCVICRRLLARGEQDICPDCFESLPNFEGEKPQVGGADGLSVTLFYEGAVRESFLRFKFSGRDFYADTYGKWMAGTICDKLGTGFDGICWVPVRKKRRRARGYDQSELLARVIAKKLSLPLVPALQKHAERGPQSQLKDAAQRRSNASGAFSVLPGADVSGKTLLLIDDIVTTGATLAECSRVLRTAGASDVVYAAFAAPRKQD
mgnify:CR=1 FL=1